MKRREQGCLSVRVRRNHLVQRPIRSPINILFSSPTMSRRLYLGRMFPPCAVIIISADNCIFVQVYLRMLAPTRLENFSMAMAELSTSVS